MMSMPLIVVAAEIRSAMERALGKLVVDADCRHAFCRDPAGLVSRRRSAHGARAPWELQTDLESRRT
jgi:hypothetical protein